MVNILSLLTEKKHLLDSLKPLPGELEKNLDDWYLVELTYSSNAIEGNTLSRRETAEVIEKGISAVISGKPLKDQLEAVNHAKAITYIKELSIQRRGHQFITEDDIKSIHHIILTGIDDRWAGIYRQVDVFVRGSDTEFPSPATVPCKMQEFITWLEAQQENHPVRIASDAHYRFVTIHPFIDGNGRTARLLMNLILIMNGYPMAIIRNEDRTQYLHSFDAARKQHDMHPFYTIIEKATERSLDMYIRAAQSNTAQNKPMLSSLPDKKLLKIGELAKIAGETVPTIRHWTKEGLLTVFKYTPGGYQLYHHAMEAAAKRIRKLQKVKRLTLAEIKKEIIK